MAKRDVPEDDPLEDFDRREITRCSAATGRCRAFRTAPRPFGGRA
ncbi:MAG TPA: hypothetical protein VMF09_15615 [Solirubrobacteraceae bacterium]|nr:hypothetical protein [Solirubrobacteraceae bacterium]